LGDGSEITTWIQVISHRARTKSARKEAMQKPIQLFEKNMAAKSWMMKRRAADKQRKSEIPRKREK
jgi:hypothetical protein